MALTLSQLGNGSGFIYVTEADGTTIISNILNDEFVWQNIQKFAVASAPLTDPTAEYAATFGHRFFGDTGGSAGSIATATEITSLIVNRASQTARYKKSASISTGVIEISRVTNDIVLLADTEGAAGADNLDTLSVSNVVDNDEITIVGANSARIVTVKHGTGNIFLKDSVDFVSAGRQVALKLRYYSAATAGWYEVFRGAVQPTVAVLRDNDVAVPVQGAVSTAMPTSGTTTFLPGVDEGYQIVDGSPALVGNVVYETGGTPIDGDEFTVDYRSSPTFGVETVTIFGITLTQTQMAFKCVVTTKYSTADLLWYSTLYVNGDTIDWATVAQVNTKEDALGNPAAEGQVLSSTVSGTRSWVPNQNNAVLHNDTSNNATGAGTSEQVLKTYTLPGGTADLNGDTIKIVAVYQTAANANGKTCSLYFGATKIAETVFDFNNDTIIVEAEVNRVGAANQSAIGKAFSWDTTTPTTTITNTGRYTTPGETLAADIDIECRATDGIDAAGDIICRQFSVSIFKKRN